MPPKKNSVYDAKGFVESNDDIKSQIITKEREEIRSKGGSMGNFFGTDKNMAATYMGFLLTIFFTIMTVVSTLVFPEHTDKIISLVTLCVGFTIGSKKSE